MLFEWMIVAFAVGIGLYFSLPAEPHLWIAGSLALTALCGVIWISRAEAILQYRFKFLLLMLCLVGLGVSRGIAHTHNVESPVLRDYQTAYDVSGWIEAVERSGSGYRWRLRLHDISRTFEEAPDVAMPKRIRVRTKTAGLLPGDGVKLRAILRAPPGPVIADGYDPARRAWFQQVGGYGFAISTPKAADIDTRGRERAARMLVTFREALTLRVLTRAPPNTAGLQAALLTGDRAYIDPEQTDVLRASGLAHVLAISGLHMGLMAGGAFWLISFLLACIDPIARRYDVRKAAAVAGILVATFYLILSGASVSTQRAYIMAVVLFLAVLLSRPAISIRTVAVAAGITLMLHPESLVSAGFQMSFAAAAALVAVYGAWRERYTPQRSRSIAGKFFANMTGLAATSAIAGVATGGFAAIHFHRVAKLGFFANLAAMPFFTFIVMPAGLAAFIMMPAGLESYPLAVMGWGLEKMLWVARAIADRPGSLSYFSAAPAYMSGAFGLSFAVLCIAERRLKAVAAFMIVGLWCVWAVNPSADMRVSASADIAFWDRTEQSRLLYVERTRADGYGVAQFMERAGDPDADVVSYAQSRADCDVRACQISLKGRVIAIAGSPEIADEECQTADIVIITQRSAGPVTRRNCRAVLIDERLLDVRGAQDVYFEKSGGITLQPANPASRAQRPWGRTR